MEKEYLSKKELESKSKNLVREFNKLVKTSFSDSIYKSCFPLYSYILVTKLIILVLYNFLASSFKLYFLIKKAPFNCNILSSIVAIVKKMRQLKSVTICHTFILELLYLSK